MAAPSDHRSAAPDSIRRGASPNLDLLRSFAVLMVLVNHLTRHYHYDHFDSIGLFGVLLFFVHTSLVLMYSMQRSHLTGLALVKDFYVRRVFRIYPLVILAVLAALALHLHAESHGLEVGTYPGTREVLSNLFLIQNLTHARSIIGPLWSLPFEVQMYLFLPFLFFWKKRTFWKLLAIWLVCALFRQAPAAIPGLAWFTLWLYIPNFLPGVIAFTRPERRVFPAWSWPLFLLLLAAVFEWRHSSVMGAAACMVLGIAIPRFKEITFGPVKFVASRIATYSYGIYLSHAFIIWYALTLHQSWILFWLMWLTIPVILYHAFEHPAVLLGKRVAEKLSADSTGPKTIEPSKAEPSPAEPATVEPAEVGPQVETAV